MWCMTNHQRLQDIAQAVAQVAGGNVSRVTFYTAPDIYEMLLEEGASKRAVFSGHGDRLDRFWVASLTIDGVEIDAFSETVALQVVEP